MQKLVRVVTNPSNILSYALGFVVAWFGLHEIFSPQDWVAFAPPFLGDGTMVLGLVVLHGVVLTTCAILLVVNFHRKIAAGILTLIFIEVVIGLLSQTGLSDIAVRDVGLGGMAMGLVFLPSRNPKR